MKPEFKKKKKLSEVKKLPNNYVHLLLPHCTNTHHLITLKSHQHSSSHSFELESKHKIYKVKIFTCLVFMHSMYSMHWRVSAKCEWLLLLKAGSALI